jgi:hypothetical protein
MKRYYTDVYEYQTVEQRVWYDFLKCTSLTTVQSCTCQGAVGERHGYHIITRAEDVVHTHRVRRQRER